MASTERLERMKTNLPGWWNIDDNSTTTQLLRAYCEELDDVASEIDFVELQVFISTASGQALDDLAKLFRLSRRAGETDDEFRDRILAYFKQFSGGGTAQSIIDAVVQATGIDPGDITITDIPDLKFLVTLTLDTLTLIELSDVIHDTVFSAKAAGTWPKFEWTIKFTEDAVTAADSSNLEEQIDLDEFILEESLIEGADEVEAVA